MKFILPITVLVSVVSALVIPDVSFATQDVLKVNSETESLASQVVDINKNLLPLDQAAELFAPIENPLNKEDGATESNIIPNRYIVVFKKGIQQPEVDFHTEWVNDQHLASAKKLYEENPTNSFFTDIQSQGLSTELGGILDSFQIDGLLSGYFGYFLEDTIELIRRNPLVAFVEKDSRVFANDFDTQNGAPWGLSRISHREALSLGSFNKYLFDNEAGEGVTSYVIDTGINIKHVEFEGRAKWGSTIPANDEDLDGNGHGTHCAGTIASKQYGVAKKAEVVAVKVLRSNGSGTMSDVVKGVEFAAKSHLQAVKDNKKGFKGSTANMSLGGGKSPSLDLAVNAAVSAGLHFAVAAGNDNADACKYSPAAAENAITVGASTLSDSRAYFSNYGECVDIFGPGLNILSTYIGSDTASATLSGTSMASPHVAGLLTYYLSLQPGSDSEFFTAKGGITPKQLKNKIIEYSTKNVLTDIPDDTPNYLIFNGGGQNLTSFWGEEPSKKEVSSSPLSFEISDEIENLSEKVEHIAEEIKELISDMF